MLSRIIAIAAIFAAGFITLSADVQAADTPLKPYVLASSGTGTITSKLPEVKAALTQQGFTIAGEYSPYKGAYVVVVTNDSLRDTAAKTELGAYGAVQRISLTETPAGLQIAYTNPLYFSLAYQLKGTLADVSASLEKALGKKADFGSKNGLKPDKLRAYHYMVMMPYFEDQVELATYPSYEAAVKTVEANLAAHKGGCTKIYRVDLPARKASVFGVAITDGEGADAAVMKVTDTAELKHTAHLPYELIVSEGNVLMLHGKFRIALDFPDLTMGTFMKISGAPAGIEEKLKVIAGKK
jgi:hypothetical protein